MEGRAFLDESYGYERQEAGRVGFLEWSLGSLHPLPSHLCLLTIAGSSHELTKSPPTPLPMHRPGNGRLGLGDQSGARRARSLRPPKETTSVCGRRPGCGGGSLRGNPLVFL